MLIKIVVLFLLYIKIKAFSSYQCEQNVGKDLSKTRCMAGRRFFARLDKSKTFNSIFSKEVLVQSYGFPWTAQVMSNYNGFQNLCGGALINDRFILTVQNCCSPPLEPIHLEVILGYINDQITSSSKCASRLNVKNIILHPHYQSNVGSSNNNVALLELEEVKYTKTIYPIRLPTKLDKFMKFTNQIVESAGYLKNNLFKVYVMKITNNQECGKIYTSDLNSDSFCCHHIENREPECSVLPGTPLLIEKTQGFHNVTILIGIASTTTTINSPCTSPIVYVRIDKNLPWILDNTHGALYCNH